MANLIVWSYWWPPIILSAIFLGRIWCAVCPMELMTSLASKVGLKRNRPAFLRSGWVMTIFYVLVLFVVRKLIVQRLPEEGWRSLTFYLIPGLYGGAFSVMLIVWRL